MAYYVYMRIVAETSDARDFTSLLAGYGTAAICHRSATATITSHPIRPAATWQ